MDLEMDLEFMIGLIRKEWYDAMSDNGAIWSATRDLLEKARAEYPKLYTEALPIAYERGML